MPTRDTNARTAWVRECTESRTLASCGTTSPKCHLHEEVPLLLVDDDAGVRCAYQCLLARSGWKVEAVASGKEAIGRVTSESFEVILSDIAMPEMSGVEFLRAVREHDLDVPVVLMTGDPGSPRPSALSSTARSSIS
jgi:CheY-like chemotaxis protein